MHGSQLDLLLCTVIQFHMAIGACIKVKVHSAAILLAFRQSKKVVKLALA
jgi:hypothetical protein